MIIFSQKEHIAVAINKLKEQNLTIGLVPTMGALHDGHLELVKKALVDNDKVFVSIFVNPTQFDNNDDLKKYPRTLEKDVALLQTVSKNNILVYAPTVNDIYGGNTASQQFDFDGLEFEMEGKFRTGHFDGVGTIVKRFFDIVKPHKAYFGEKDFQQLRLIRGMVKAFFLDVEVVPCPIIRESDGLAMSSRNLRLSKKEREIAPQLFAIISSGQSIERMQKMIEAAGFELDYLATQGDRLLVAATLGEIRLIDNVPYDNLRTLKKPVELRLER